MVTSRRNWIVVGKKTHRFTTSIPNIHSELNAKTNSFDTSLVQSNYRWTEPINVTPPFARWRIDRQRYSTHQTRILICLQFHAMHRFSIQIRPFSKIQKNAVPTYRYIASVSSKVLILFVYWTWMDELNKACLKCKSISSGYRQNARNSSEKFFNTFRYSKSTISMDSFNWHWTNPTLTDDIQERNQSESMNFDAIHQKCCFVILNGNAFAHHIYRKAWAC